MARKKQQTYNEMIQMMGDMRKKIDTEKARIGEILASELDYNTAMVLGDLSDAELRCIAAFMFRHLKMFRNLVKVDMPRPQQLQAAEDKPMVEGELRYNHDEDCWEAWDTDTDRPVGKLHRGMSVELQSFTGGEWEPVEVGVFVQDFWYLTAKAKNDPNGSDKFLGLFDGLRVRFHNVDD